MTFHTILPLEIVLDGIGDPKRMRRTVEIRAGGMLMEVEPLGDGYGRIVRLPGLPARQLPQARAEPRQSDPHALIRACLAEQLSGASPIWYNRTEVTDVGEAQTKEKRNRLSFEI
jgi:hypothetical protein